MPPIPPEIDELMWELVDQRDNDAKEAFYLRYPEHRAELESRLHALSALRASKPEPTEPPPLLLDLHPPNVVRMSRWSLAAAACMLILAVGLGATALIKQYMNPAGSSVTMSAPTTSQSPAESADASARSKEITMENRASGANSSELEAPSSTQAGAVNEDFAQDPANRPVTIEEKSISLKAAIQRVCLLSGMAVEFAPGFIDETVQVQYVDVPAMFVLKSLGQSFGFTPVQQDSRNLLIVPAADPNAPILTDPGTTRPGVNEEIVPRTDSQGPPPRRNTGDLPVLPDGSSE